MQQKLKIVNQVRQKVETALNSAEPDDKVIVLEDKLRISRTDAEMMMKFLEKCSQIETEEEFEKTVKQEYDNIPYIIGATDETVVGRFQLMVESIAE